MLLEILKHILTQPDGHLVLFNIARRAVAGTPLWVWGLFVALVALGLSQARARTVSETRLAVGPLAMAAYSLYGVTLAFGWSLTATAAWVIGLALTLGAGWVLKRPGGVRYVAESRRFEVPGSWIPLALILVIFLVRYLLAVSMAIDPSLRLAATFVIGTALAYGLLGGVFPARAVRIWSLRNSN
ncbi:MAG: DUF6622 family protein [Burkholderiales bacterium]